MADQTGVPNTFSSLAQRKHQALLDRLSAAATATAARRSSSSDPCSVSSFLSSFSSSKLSIESSLSDTRSLPDPKPELDRISASIASLEQLLAENSYYLPSYELRSCLKSIADLKSALETANSELLPKKKFSFRNKVAKKEEPKKIDGVQFKPCDNTERSNLSIVHDSPGFRNKTGEILVKDFRFCDNGEGEFTLSDLENCKVYLKGRIRALFFNRIKNCQVYTGPVLGSVLIEDVSDCIFMIASHQIRIHEAKRTDFYLHVRSRPIIEDSNGVRFAPYRLIYQGIKEELNECGLGEETNNWANVDDFKWLRAVQSPNWCLIPEKERSEIIDISEITEDS